MKEKIKTEKPTGSGDAPSVFDGLPDLPGNPNVTVSSGPYSEDLPVAANSTGEVRRKFSDRLDIDKDAQAIVDGKPVDENYILKGGEQLMFVKHAGEKGNSRILIDGDHADVIASQREVPECGKGTMPLKDLLERCGPGISTGEVILPAGVRTVLSRDQITLWVWEQAPRIHQLSWIKADSPEPYGKGASYRKVRIALPYLVVVAVFYRYPNGMPVLLQKDECFFRTEPLKSLDDELLYPGLLNCSQFSPKQIKGGSPLSWICTQHLKPNPQMSSKLIGDRFQGGFEAVRYCLLETSFNLSSEHHEANSWYGESKKIDPRIATIEAWEENTAKDPLFVLEVPWIKTNHSVRQLTERIFQIHCGGNGAVKNADDLARIIINSQ